MKIAAALFLIASTAALADEPKKEMSPEEKAMMEKYMKAATPGPEHAELAKMAGKWTLAVSMWMAPGAPAMKSQGSSTFTSVLGGRFLQEETKGEMNGQPFEGMGLQGYDNVTKQYFSSWVDNMGTGPMNLKGKCAQKKCTLHGKMADAIAGKEVAVSEVMTQTDNDHFTFTMWGPGPDGKQFKTMQIDYTRAP